MAVQSPLVQSARRRKTDRAGGGFVTTPPAAAAATATSKSSAPKRWSERSRRRRILRCRAAESEHGRSLEQHEMTRRDISHFFAIKSFCQLGFVSRRRRRKEKKSVPYLYIYNIQIPLCINKNKREIKRALSLDLYFILPTLQLYFYCSYIRTTKYIFVSPFSSFYFNCFSSISSPSRSKYFQSRIF